MFFSSCFELEETYNINEDGSYALNYNVDMGNIIGLISRMSPDSVKATKEYNIGKDTTINFGSAMPADVKKNLNPKEIELMKQTNMRTQMNISKGVFKIGFNSQGKSIEDLKYFLSNFSQTFQKAKLNKTVMSTPRMSPDLAAGEDETEMPFKNEEFDYVITANSFERKIKPAVIAAQRAKDQKAYDMVKAMNMKMTSTIVINLPRAAKSIENPKAMLSADKKQFKLQIDMLEAIDKPEMLNFKVNY